VKKERSQLKEERSASPEEKKACAIRREKEGGYVSRKEGGDRKGTKIRSPILVPSKKRAAENGKSLLFKEEGEGVSVGRRGRGLVEKKGGSSPRIHGWARFERGFF